MNNARRVGVSPSFCFKPPDRRTRTTLYARAAKCVYYFFFSFNFSFLITFPYTSPRLSLSLAFFPSVSNTNSSADRPYRAGIIIINPKHLLLLQRPRRICRRLGGRCGYSVHTRPPRGVCFILHTHTHDRVQINICFITLSVVLIINRILCFAPRTQSTRFFFFFFKFSGLLLFRTVHTRAVRDRDS